MVDEEGLNFIKQFEGFSPTPYQDEHGVWTIGYGHTEGITKDTLPISQMQADALLEGDLEDAENTVDKLVTIELSQKEYNALVSFVFNEGYSRFHHSTLLHKLNAGDKAGAAKEFLRWVYFEDPKTKEMCISGGLAIRRRKEADLFSEDFKEKKDSARND